MIARFASAADVDDARQLQAAALVYASLPAYYDLFAAAGAAVPAALAKLFHARGSPIEHAEVALDDAGVVVGVVAAFDVGELTRTGFAELQVLRRELKSASREVQATLHDALRAHAEHVTALPADVGGRYLARIAVAPHAQGRGLADRLLDRFETPAAAATQFSLHVHRDNARAIRFYERRGYRFTVDDGARAYRVMMLSPS